MTFTHSFKSIRPALLLLLLLLTMTLIQPTTVCADEKPLPPSTVLAGSTDKGATTKPIKDSVMTIKTPGNVVELMENLRDVLRSGVVFDEAFYTEDNVRKITAATDVEVVRRQEKPLLLEIETFDFRTIADNLESYGGGLSIDFKLETRPDGKKSAVVYGNIISDQPLLHYRVIEKLIGYAWQPSEPEPWSSNRLYPEPTDPYGNKEREYNHQDGGIEETGRFEFGPAGLLSRFTLRREER